MYHVGVDLHKDSMTVAVGNEVGEIVRTEKIPCKCINKVRDFFSQPEISSSRVAVEAVGFYHWFWDEVSPKVAQMVLANAIETHKYSKDPKTDFRDAKRLAHLSCSGEFERNQSLNVFVPDLELRTLREVTRHRDSLARNRASVKNRIRRYCLKKNLPGPKVLDAASYQKWLFANEDKFSSFHRFALRELEDQLILLSRQIKDTERIITEFMEKERLKETKRILCSIPGVGEIVAATIIAEVGDFSRFPSAEQLTSYAGLVPRVFQSGQSERHGRVTKEGPANLRWMLQQAAWVAIRQDRRIHQTFERIARKAGRKKAAVAIARKILVWAWYLIKDKKEFRATTDAV